MAGAGRKVFVSETLSSDEVQRYLMDQSVMVFASGNARSAAIPTPSEGMVTYLLDVDKLDAYDGTAWRCFGVLESLFTAVGLNGGWNAVTGKGVRAKRTTAGQVKLHGRFSNAGAFVPNATQLPLQPLGSTFRPGTELMLELPYVGAAYGRVLCTLLPDGRLRLDNNGGVSIAAGSVFSLDAVQFDPGYTGT